MHIQKRAPRTIADAPRRACGPTSVTVGRLAVQRLRPPLFTTRATEPANIQNAIWPTISRFCRRMTSLIRRTSQGGAHRMRTASPTKYLVHAHAVRSGHCRDVGARYVGFGPDQILCRLRSEASRSRRTRLQRLQDMKRLMLSHVSRLVMITPERIRRSRSSSSDAAAATRDPLDAYNQRERREVGIHPVKSAAM